LGVYRDVGFAQNVVEFLAKKATDPSQTPWLAVGSLVNPHDLGYTPEPWALPADQGVVDWVGWPPPPRIPGQGEKSNEQEMPPEGSGNYRIVDLNPDGFPQETFHLPPTIYEQLKANNKPRCQYDYSLKFGLMAKAIQENDMAGQLAGFVSPHPYQFRKDAEAWYLAYGQFYMYCMYLADQRLHEMLQALDDTPGLAENTIVVFLSDHGELAGAHGGMIQKWHNAYEESIHVPMVVSSPLVNRDASKMKEIVQPTSSIDVAPTLLGLAGYEPKMLLRKMQQIHGRAKVRAFVGADLSPHIKGGGAGRVRGPDGNPRTGVLFMTNDTITELGPTGDVNDYNRFMENVDAAIGEGYPLEPGTVTQPNRVRALCTGDWKIVHYIDPDGLVPDEWELYSLVNDPIEQTNLVDFRTGEVRDDVAVPGLNKNQLRSINKQLRKELARQEVLMLG